MGHFNAHCHLELSALAGRLPPGLPFVEWLERLVPLKRQTDPLLLRKAAHDGLARLRETGTTVLADIVSLGITPDILPHADAAPFRSLLFCEIIEFQPDAGEAAVRDAIGSQQQQCGGAVESAPGLSPHAPYTTSEPLLRAAARESRRLGQWLCIHAAEDPAERRMFLHGRGPLRDFLAPHLPPTWNAPAMGPIHWLDHCGCLGPRTLLVHCNDIDDRDIRLLARRGCSVVVCPGTHVYFGRGRFPLGSLIEAGIPVYLGTDSLASNEDLDMEREIKLARALSPGVEEDRIRALAHEDRALPFFPS